MTVLDVERVRSHFDFPATGPGGHEQRGEHPAAAGADRAARGAGARVRERPPRAVGGLAATTALFEASYDTIAQWLNAPEPAQHRDVPQHHRGDQRGDVLAAHRVPRRRQRRHHDDGAQLQLRPVVRDVPRDPAAVRAARGVPLARFDHRTGELDLDHLAVAGRRADQARLLHRRVELPRHQAAAGRSSARSPTRSGYRSRRRRAPVAAAGRRAPSWCPSSSVDVQALDVDYLAFSFHKMLAPFGVGVLYAKEHLLGSRPSVPVRRRHDRRGRGSRRTGSSTTTCRGSTPPARRTSSASIVSAQALRLLVDLVGPDGAPRWFGNDAAAASTAVVERRWTRVGGHTARADRAGAAEALDDRRAHGLRAARRDAAVAAGRVQRRRRGPGAASRRAWTTQGVESRAGCHCATLAHRALGLTPPGQLPAELRCSTTVPTTWTGPWTPYAASSVTCGPLQPRESSGECPRARLSSDGPGIGSASAARDSGASKGSAKYWVSCATYPPENSMMLTECDGRPS